MVTRRRGKSGAGESSARRVFGVSTRSTWTRVTATSGRTRAVAQANSSISRERVERDGRHPSGMGTDLTPGPTPTGRGWYGATTQPYRRMPQVFDLGIQLPSEHAAVCRRCLNSEDTYHPGIPQFAAGFACCCGQRRTRVSTDSKPRGCFAVMGGEDEGRRCGREGDGAAGRGWACSCAPVSQVNGRHCGGVPLWRRWYNAQWSVEAHGMSVRAKGGERYGRTEADGPWE